MNPFDLSGPSFLLFFALCFVSTVVLAFVVRHALRTPGGEPDDLDLSPYEAAYLAGGAASAAHAAVANLVRRGEVKIDDKAGTVSPMASFAARDPVEREVFLRVVGSGVSLAALRAKSDETTTMHEQLAERGLLVSGRQSFWVRVLPFLLVMSLVVLAGVKILVGLERERPVNFLCIAAVVVCVVAVCFLWPPYRSQRGDRALARLRDDHEPLRVTATRKPDALGEADFVLAVGLFGPAVLEGTDLALARFLQAPSHRDGSTGGGCGGDGGGGGCGGGCGGCGGCGG